MSSLIDEIKNFTLLYKGFVAKAEYDEDIGMFHGRVSNIKDVINFYGKTPSELNEEMKISINEYLKIKG